MVKPDFLIDAKDVTIPAVSIVGAAFLGILIHQLVFALLAKTFERPRTERIGRLIAVARKPLSYGFPLIGILTALSMSVPDSANEQRAEHILGIALMAVITWAIIAMISASAEFIVVGMNKEDELRRREVATRVLILSRTFSIIVGLLVAGAALISFPSVRAIGTTLVASAGIAGIAAGFAARPVLENLVAGIQLAFTQPIRIDDEVIVEGDYGRIERITATYVVIRTWDRRRMIVPLTYFFDHPFQNWSIQAGNMIGVVLLWVDFSVPIGELRAEVQRIVANNPLWDHDVVGVQVTDASEKSMQIRILATGRTAPETFDLRCAIREGLLDFLQTRYPNSLPRDRFNISGAEAAALTSARLS